MPHYDLQLCSNGMLSCIEWSKEDQIYEKFFVPEDEIPYHLGDTICIQRGATLRHLLRVILPHVGLFAAATGQIGMEAFVEEGFSDTDEEKADLAALELEWAVSVDREDGEILLVENMHFCGRMYDGTQVALEFTPVNQLIDVLLEINDVYHIRDDRDPEKVLFSAMRPMTLLQLVDGVMSELGFMETPERRDREMKLIVEQYKKFRSNGKNGVSLESVCIKMDERCEEDRKRFPCRKCGNDSRCACFDKPHNLCHKCFKEMEEG